MFILGFNISGASARFLPRESRVYSLFTTRFRAANQPRIAFPLDYYLVGSVDNIMRGSH